jgi:hypothetical protein
MPQVGQVAADGLIQRQSPLLDQAHGRCHGERFVDRADLEQRVRVDG